ncbi:hypothetical protein N0V82_000867 [Gnomoniopsis sp. IMI 355080]|nr:hypothetical protein N0V82_000867 [Gnomoniopsis sp. IMI 355080]
MPISRLRHITFTMTPAHVEGWLNGAVASGYHPVTLESQVAIPYWGGGAPPDAAGGAYRAAWREVVSVLTTHADLPRLSLTIDMGECTWVYIEDWGMTEDEPNDEDRANIRFIYDFYADVVTALCALRGLGALNLKLSAFQQLKPWLEREVLGRESPEPVFESAMAQRRWTDLWRRPRWHQVLPRWHDGDRRLEGSNYQP